MLTTQNTQNTGKHGPHLLRQAEHGSTFQVHHGCQELPWHCEAKKCVQWGIQCKCCNRGPVQSLYNGALF